MCPIASNVNSLLTKWLQIAYTLLYFIRNKMNSSNININQQYSENLPIFAFRSLLITKKKYISE